MGKAVAAVDCLPCPFKCGFAIGKGVRLGCGRDDFAALVDLQCLASASSGREDSFAFVVHTAGVYTSTFFCVLCALAL